MIPGVFILLLAILGFFLWCHSQPREYGGAGGFGTISDLDYNSGFFIR